MTGAAPHLLMAVSETSGIGAARRAAVQLAAEGGLDEVATGRVAIVATELSTNLARHASNGRLLVRFDAQASHLEMISLDDGPGMPDVQRCMADGFSTAGSAGEGLGAVRRQSDEFGIYSRVGTGSVVASRIGSPRAADRSAFVTAGISLCAPHETACGDAWSLSIDGKRIAVIVADGLGHGPEAAAAALEAVGVFRKSPFDAPSAVLEAAHGPMRSTRGAAVSIATLDADNDKLVFCGVGNVIGRVISGIVDRTLMTQMGTLGLQIRHLRDAPYEWPDHAILVLHSDGVVSRWNLAADSALLGCHPMVIAGWLIREHVRGRDDATVVVIRRA